MAGPVTKSVAVGGTKTGPADGQRGSTVAMVRETIREAILAGDLAPGQRLVEAFLTERFGVSRPSIRAALGRLAAEGIVELVPNRGAIVRQLRRKEIFDRYQIREQLEGLAAGLAAERWASNARSAELLEALRPSIGPNFQVEERRAENLRFHEAVAEASGNSQLWGAIQRVSLPTEMVALRRQHDADPDYWDLARAEHASITAAILACNAELAAAQMRSHVRRVREDFMKLPPSLFGID
jgi:DNA-binding GntR family transcriptional regulator